ncbi:LysR family transcriptional regulator [Rhizobium sp. KVB221]|uniref:HTH-type transcriptional regulator TtuA n=1 Tax=Rhizobium setariae TaxID=2801340 RepID=A0A936YNR0_9HYPH|nr:LysR family transcriptional regulator [Rhizobium setariae]MBL0373964.1 LysR family transcriptional regulator [Rhizobium setariae]
MKLNRSMIPDLSVLQAFECAARHGNFTLAGAELNLTQSAVSRQIRALEDQLGVSLFERIRQRVVLSPAGQALLPEVIQVLGQTEEMVLRAMAAADGKKALSVATLPTFGARWLMRRLPAFLERHPGTVVNVASRSEPFDFAVDRFDVAIHYGQPNWARGNCTYLCSETILPVASPALMTRWPAQAPSDFVGAPLLHLATRPKLWSEWLEMDGQQGVNAFHGSRFDQFNMIIEAAVAGMGFALLPRYLIEEELQSGKLSIVIARTMTTDQNYYVVLPEGKGLNPTASAFQTWLIEQVLPGEAAKVGA